MLIESVILRIATGRTTLCVSSQVGCAAACDFCATGKMGIARNLSPAEILDQVVQARQIVAAEGRTIRNLVFMGMGEPFHNEENLYATLDALTAPELFHHPPSRILVSTVGLPDAMIRARPPLSRRSTSRSACTAPARKSASDSSRWRAAIRSTSCAAPSPSSTASSRRTRTVMIEYLMLAGVNDSPDDARELVDWLAGLRVHVNLIPYNPIDDAPHLAGSDRADARSVRRHPESRRPQDHDPLQPRRRRRRRLRAARAPRKPASRSRRRRPGLNLPEAFGTTRRRPMRVSLALSVLSCFALGFTQFAAHPRPPKRRRPRKKRPRTSLRRRSRPSPAPTRRSRGGPARSRPAPRCATRTWPNSNGICKASAATSTAIFDRARRAHRDELLAEPDPRTPGEQAQAWADQMRALGEEGAAKRAEAVAAMRAALEGDDADLQLAALQALSQIGDVNYDKAAFRGLVFPFVREGSGSLLIAACYALFNTDRRSNDLLLIQEAWTRRSAALDNAMSHLLFMYSDGIIEGRSEEIILELLDSPHVDARRETLRGIWGASVSDRLAARIVELADDPESHGDAIYFGLSTFKPKNEVVVDKLIETLTDPDWNNWDRALWGLGYGVPEELQPRVAEALAEMYVARSDPRTREKCRELIRQYGGEDAVEALPQ